MSIKVMSYVWDHSKSKSNNRLMLLAIADIANDSGDAYPGVDRLASKCNVATRTAQDSIRELERIKELQVYENVGTKTTSGWTNLYRIIMEGVKGAEIRAPSGEIAKPRAISDKKPRSFPKEVQTVAPLQKSDEVQTVAPDEVKLVAPHEVQTVAPKPSVELSVELNTNTLTPDAADVAEEYIDQHMKKIETGEMQTVKPRKMNPNQPIHDELLSCWKLTPETITRTGDKPYWIATAELASIKFPIEAVKPLHKWCVAQNWQSLSVMAMAKYAGQFLATWKNPVASNNPAHQRVIIIDEPESTQEQRELIKSLLKQTGEKMLVSDRNTNGR